MNKLSNIDEWNLWVTNTAMKVADEMPGHTVTHEYNPDNLRETLSIRKDDGNVIYSIELSSLISLYNKDKQGLTERIIFSLKAAVNGIFNN